MKFGMVMHADIKEDTTNESASVIYSNIRL